MINFSRSIIAAALMTLGTAAASAQSTYKDADGNEYEFKSHAYLQLHGGAQYTLGESSFGDLISPNVQLGIGYQFCPWFGARLAVNGWQSKGGFNGHGVGEPAGTYGGNTTYKYKYVAPGIDLMFNLSNALCGYNPKRVLNVSAFVGGGANIAWGNDEANALYNRGFVMSYIWDGTKVRPVGRAGLAVDFRLSDAVSLGLEGNANVMTDKFNSKNGDNPDWYFNVLAGLKINLGKSYTRKAAPAPAPVEPVVEPVVEEKPAPAPEPVEVKKETIRRDIFFKINSFRIDEENEKKVAELADFLNAHSDAKLTVTSYADAGTGTNAINNRLAEQRTEAVVSLLTHRYKIDASRIVSDSKGDSVQPFADNDMNRVSICISEE